MSHRWILGDEHPHNTVKQQQGNHHVSGHGEGDTRVTDILEIILTQTAPSVTHTVAAPSLHNVAYLQDHS